MNSFFRLGIVFSAVLAVAGCEDPNRRSARHYVPLPSDLIALMNEKGMSKHDPILIRSFKKEAELEIWKRARDGKMALLKTYPICRWSGQLGPKHREGDRQAPEGFYHITAQQMNPNSAFHLSFDMGFPNAYDRAYGRTGSFLMVHGGCSSRGCYSMTDKQIEEIYALVREAHSGGQSAVQMQAFPFRMTAENLAKHRFDKNMPFWKMLKEGSDHFDVSKVEPKVAVCNGRYTFNRKDGCSGEVDETLKQMVAQKQLSDERQVADLISKGTPAVRVTYADGGQHPTFRNTVLAYSGGSGVEERDTRIVAEPRRSVPSYAEVSRPEALAEGPKEVVIGPDGKPIKAAAKPVVTASIPKPDQRPDTKPVVAASTPSASATAEAPSNAPSVTAVTKVEKPASEQPIYQRIFSIFSATKTEPDSTSELPKTAPLPPSRSSDAKPPVKIRPGQKTSALTPYLNGAHPALPADLIAYSPIEQ